MPGKFTQDGERFVGLAFLDGRSIGDIAQAMCCSNRAVEAVLRAQLKHLIETKKPERDQLSIDEVVAQFAAKGLTVEPVQADTQPQPVPEQAAEVAP